MLNSKIHGKVSGVMEPASYCIETRNNHGRAGTAGGFLSTMDVSAFDQDLACADDQAGI